MTDKINKELHLSESMQNLKEKIRKHKLMRWKRIITAAFLGFMIIFGSYLLLEYRTYEGFPKSVCTSLNNEICHGIPDKNIILQEGDIINVDVSTILDGYFSDASRMFKIGTVSERAERIVRVTEECVELGLKAAKPWGHLGDIADAIYTHAQKNGYSVVEDIGGHGIGLEFHEEPFVSYVTPKGSEMVLVPGMMFTIEPMLNEGSPDFFVDEDNDWTVYTIDDGLSAQIEYMVLVTETGIEVLTK